MLPPDTAPVKKPAPAGLARAAGFTLATWFGVGYVPVAPGTFGTLAAVPLAWALGRAGALAYLGATVALAALGIVAADVVVRALGREDPQIVVVDEVAGYLLTLAMVPRDGLHLATGFVLFRLLDIWKPGPMGWLDRNVRGGLGVMADDLLAGGVGALLMWAGDAAGVAALW